MRVKVNKGYIQVNANYVKIDRDTVDTEFCKTFEEKLSESPQEIFKNIASSPIFDNAYGKFLTKDRTEEEPTEEEGHKDEF